MKLILRNRYEIWQKISYKKMPERINGKRDGFWKIINAN
jgi:hypothetical protein